MALVAQYLFADNANDKTGVYHGEAINLTYENAPEDKWFGGGKVAVFAGNSRVNIPAIPPISGTSAKTFEWWGSVTERNYVTSQYTVFSGSTYMFPTIWFAQQNDINISCYQQHVKDSEYYSKKFVDNSLGWHHYVLVIPANGNVNTTTFFVDGKQTTQTTGTVGSNSTSYSSSQTYALGCRRYNSSYYYKGKMANFRIWNEALASTTIAEHYVNESVPAPVNSVNYLDWDYRRHRDCKLVKPLDD